MKIVIASRGSKLAVTQSEEVKARLEEYDSSLEVEIKIINTPIDTYSMVRGARNLESYCLRGVTWTATDNDVQYCLRTKESIKDPSVIPTYYVYDANDKEYKLWGQATYPTDDRMLYERMEMV